jgi:hypothetical protein
MFGKGLTISAALYLASAACALAADLSLPAPPPDYSPPRHVGRALMKRHFIGGGYVVEGSRAIGVPYGGPGLAWGLTPDIGQLGAAGFGYYGVDGCWINRPAYDAYGHYFGVRAVNMCVN